MNIYQHSGKIGYGLVILPIGGIPILLLLACIYAYISVYNPIGGYITFLIILGYALACGIGIGLLLKFSKCRNTAFCWITGVIGGLLSVYFAWSFFLFVLLNRLESDAPGFLDVTLSPLIAWNLIIEINQTGWFSIKGSTPSGIFLWILWGIEAGTIFFVTLFPASQAIENEMFCEKCNIWCNVTQTKYLTIPTEIAALEASEISILSMNNLKHEENISTRPAIKAELVKCPPCINYAGWKYSMVKTEIDKNGNEKDSLKSISGISMA
jgi:hypothetical protein